MEWSAKVELYEQLRREYEFGIGTIRGVARKFGVHRRQFRGHHTYLGIPSDLGARRPTP